MKKIQQRRGLILVKGQPHSSGKVWAQLLWILCADIACVNPYTVSMGQVLCLHSFNPNRELSRKVFLPSFHSEQTECQRSDMTWPRLYTGKGKKQDLKSGLWLGRIRRVTREANNTWCLSLVTLMSQASCWAYLHTEIHLILTISPEVKIIICYSSGEN